MKVLNRVAIKSRVVYNQNGKKINAMVAIMPDTFVRRCFLKGQYQYQACGYYYIEQKRIVVILQKKNEKISRFSQVMPIFVNIKMTRWKVAIQGVSK